LKDVLGREQFLEYLREALNHLYAPERLRKSPLANLFGVADRFDTASALQRVLIDAIASLKPPTGEPSQSPAWQIYEPLFYRYVEQLSAEEVADQLGVGTRHLRRWQNTAQEALADWLWKQFNLTDQVAAQAHSGEGRAEAVPVALNQELAWLKSETGASITDLAQTLPPVFDLAGKLAERHAVQLDFALTDDLPKVCVPSVALRQVLINLLSVVIPRAAGGQVKVSVQVLQWDVEIRVRCAQCPSQAEEEAENLSMARQLAELGGCCLTLEADAQAFDARLTLPALEHIPVLAIDDSHDTLQLWQRYAADSHYRLIGTRDAEHALDLAAKVSPQIIVLDVMMPHVDGWEMLGRLRQHPLTSGIPVIVCTILAQKELALLLGASDFLRKPVNRPDFLAALDRQIERMGSELN
jgi:CheY-like chemotaxis protein